MLITKARISACDPSGSEIGASFYVQFNPNEISINEYVGSLARKKSKPPKENKAAEQKTPSEIQATTMPPEEKEGITFSTKLFFNTYNSSSDFSDVRKLISNFDKFLNKKAQEDKELNRIRFSWGSIKVFGVLTAMNVSYTMFSHNGYPVRAEASITINGDYVDVVPAASTGIGIVNIHTEKSTGFSAALAKYGGDIEKLKQSARAKGITNLRKML